MVCMKIEPVKLLSVCSKHGLSSSKVQRLFYELIWKYCNQPCTDTKFINKLLILPPIKKLPTDTACYNHQQLLPPAYASFVGTLGIRCC